MEETEDKLFFRSGKSIPSSAKTNDHLPLIARRLHVLINHKLDETSKGYLAEVNAAMERHNSKLSRFKIKAWTWLLANSLFKRILTLFVNTAWLQERVKTYHPVNIGGFEALTSLPPLQRKPERLAADPIPDLGIPELFLTDPSWESLEPHTIKVSDSLRYYELSNRYLLIYRNGLGELTYALCYKSQNLQTLAADLVRGGRYRLSKDLCNVLPKLQDWIPDGKFLDTDFCVQAGRYLPQSQQLDTYYRNWIRKNWDQKEIDRRFWHVFAVIKGDKFIDKSERTHCGDWLIHLMLPLISPIPAVEKTEENLKLFAERLNVNDSIPNNLDFLSLFQNLLEDPKLAQSDQAVYLLKYGRLPVTTLLLRAGTQDRNLPPGYGKKEHTVSALQALLSRYFYGTENEDLFLECAAALAKEALTVDFKSGKKGTLFEDIYNTEHLSQNLRVKILALLIYYGASLSRQQIYRFKQDFAKGDLLLLPLLFAKGHLTAEEYALYSAPAPGHQKLAEANPAELKTLLLRALPDIQVMAQRSQIAQDAVDFEQVTFWRALKKEAKKMNVDPAARESFRQAYLRLVQNHPLLKLLREVSRETRDVVQNKNNRLSNKVCVVLGMWKRKNSALHSDDAVHLIRQNPLLFQNIRSRIVNVAARYFKDPFWYACRNLWVHGTKSAALILMRKRVQQQLLAAGTLLKLGIAPPCGEMCGSHMGANSTRITGECPSPSWEDARNTHYLTASNFEASIEYASKETHYKEMVFNPEEAWKLATREAVEKVIEVDKNGNPYIENWFSDLTSIQVAILRLRMTDRQADVKLDPLLKWVQNEKDNQVNPKIIPVVHDALTCKVPFFLEKEDLEKITAPYPILFGCPDHASIPHDAIKGRYNEYLSEEGMQLGRDIQMAFTTPENVTQLEKDLAGTSVRVDNFDMARMIEMMEMMRGSEASTRSIQCNSLKEAQVHLNQHLQQAILPYYAAKLPEVPQGRPVAKPFARGALTYADYVKNVQNGQLAREEHDDMHSARTTFWTQIQAVLYARHATHVKNPILLGITGALHDSARQDEYEDQDEKASSANVAVYLKRLKVPPADIEKYVRAVAEKDPSSKVYEDEIQEIVHNADCFEIKRCLRDPTHFDKARLSFTKMAQSLDPKYLDDLLQEITHFIDLTNTEKQKKELEWDAPQYYLGLLQIFKKQHLEHSSYPLLYDLAQELLPD